MHICICVYVYICIYAYMYMCICVYMYMCICVYVYICIYVYIVLSSSNIHCLHALVDIYGDNELSSISAGSHDSMHLAGRLRAYLAWEPAVSNLRVSP